MLNVFGIKRGGGGFKNSKLQCLITNTSRYITSYKFIYKVKFFRCNKNVMCLINSILTPYTSKKMLHNKLNM